MNKTIDFFFLILLSLQQIVSAQPSVSDSAKTGSISDSTLTSLKFYNPQLQFNLPDSIEVRFDAPREEDRAPYYDSRNIIPDNPLELDYRESSYYTPRMVSDRLDQIMNRPRSDSFVPIPSLAILAASVALQMINVDFSSQASALDYLQDQHDLMILKALWKESPQTVTELLQKPQLKEKYSYKTIEGLLEELSNLNLVKRKLIEAGPTQYFPAQGRTEVILALKGAQETQQLSDDERTTLLRITNFLQED